MIYTDLFELREQMLRNPSAPGITFTPEEHRVVRRALMLLSNRTWGRYDKERGTALGSALHAEYEFIEALIERVGKK